MSLERLQLLENYFAQKGWVLEIDAEQDPFEVVKEKLVWHLRHHDPKLGELELEFWLCNNFGTHTEDLNDLFYCNVKGKPERLYFSRISSNEWNTAYKQFVDRLTQYASPSNPDPKTYYITEIDAVKCMTYRGLFAEFAAAFNFPHSDSTSYHAVIMDCMRDLGWLRQRNYKLTVINNRKAEKHPEKAQELRETLETIQAYWSERQLRSGDQKENDFILEYRD